MTLVLPSVPSLIPVRGFGQNQPTAREHLGKGDLPLSLRHPPTGNLRARDGV